MNSFKLFTSNKNLEAQNASRQQSHQKSIALDWLVMDADDIKRRHIHSQLSPENWLSLRTQVIFGQYER